MPIEKIVVDPPTSETRRERIERRVLEGMRIGRRRGEGPARLPLGWWAVSTAVAAAAVALFVTMSGGGEERGLAVSSEIVSVGPARIELGDAVVEVGPGTRLGVEHAANGAFTLTLARGRVTSDVEPRQGRPRYRVLAGETTVEVVGTKFTVAREGDAAQVSVERGKVLVMRGEENVVVAAGGKWPSPEPEPAPVLRPEPPTPPEPQAQTGPSAEELFRRGQQLEQRHKPGAARLWRQAADQEGFWAQEALNALADLEVEKRPAAALQVVDEYLRRFPRGVHVQDVRWSRIEALLALGQKAQARQAARDYLAKHPKGTYEGNARVIVDSK